MHFVLSSVRLANNYVSYSFLWFVFSIQMTGIIKYSSVLLSSSLPEPLYLQLANELQRIVDESCLNRELRLPSQRQLSEELDVDRSTIRRAYNELLRRSFVERRSANTLYVSRQSRRRAFEVFPNIGIVLPMQFSLLIEMNAGIALRYITGIIDNAAERNMATQMLQLPAPAVSQKEIDAYLDELQRRVSGIVHLGSRNHDPDPPLQCLLADKRIAQVSISGHVGEPHVASVTADPCTGARALAEHLKLYRHQRVGFVLWSESCPPAAAECIFRYDSHERSLKIKNVLLEYGLHFPEQHQLYGCQNPVRLQEQLQTIIKKKDLPDVFCCYNDVLAGQVLKQLEDAGLRVPEDVSLVGYDGASQESFNERLTSIQQPFYAMGYSAVDKLIEIRENGADEKKRRVVLQTALVLKNTLALNEKKHNSIKQKMF